MPVWRKSARSGGNGGNCVEVADNLSGLVAVRESKDTTGRGLIFVRDECADVLVGLERQSFDR